ncbi:MAG: phosphoglucosamine mutase [Frankiaceae bacterium]
MGARLFGTDGIRGVANVDLTAELALDLAVSAAHVLIEHLHTGSRRPTALVGRDPRASGEFLEAAVVAGLASAGVDVVRLDVVPTPAVAYLTAASGADLGVMLSASHNPMPDNGIKLFDSGGFKLADSVEDEIEARLGEDWRRPVGAAVGRVRTDRPAVGRYLEHLLATLPHSLDGMRVVVDAAHGAAAEVAPEALRRAGAEVIAIGAEPDGWNINDGYGSTYPERLSAAVLEHGADVGIAHDGDADRCLAVDATGELIDGDAILAICALAERNAGRLVGNTVVTTVMTNLGFKHAMQAEGIGVVQTPVGDRYVLDAMRQRGFTLGGEQSGHVVFLDHATTGDGVLTALQLLGHTRAAGMPIRELAAVMTRLPQVLVNVKVIDQAAAMNDAAVRDEVAAVEADLGGDGRVLVRPSGTEPLVRVMVEATTGERARAAAERIAVLLR